MKATIIYNRVSTEEQNPENQLKDCQALKDKLGLVEFDYMPEKVSGFKDIDRPVFDSIKGNVELGRVKNIIVWDLDRLYRNRKKLIAFFELCKLKGCKVYSYRQSWLEDLNKIPSPFNEIMFNLMLQIMGWLAEEESLKKSERVRASVRKEEGITKSYKGNKWGRKALSQNVIEQILKARQEGKSITEISKQVFYWDKSNNKRFVSRAVVHKTISNKPS